MHFARDDDALQGSSPYGRPDAATAGPILIQGFLQYLCQGVIITQAKKFYERWQDDPVTLRAYVFTLVVFSILQTILESYKVWTLTIVGVHWWTSKLHFTEFLWNTLICSLCEVFLIRRCFRMTGKKIWVLVCLAGLSVATLAASVVLTVKIAMMGGPDGHVDPLHASVFAYPLWVYGTLAMALSLTAILSCSLLNTRTGLTHLDRTLGHIIALTWETAALPAACMLASAIIYSIRDARGGAHRPSAFAETNLDLFFAILTGKVYTLGLLRTLNSRTQFRARLTSSCIGRRSLSGYQWADAERDAQNPAQLGVGNGVGLDAGDALGPLDEPGLRKVDGDGVCAIGLKTKGREFGVRTSVTSTSDSLKSPGERTVHFEDSPRIDTSLRGRSYGFATETMAGRGLNDELGAEDQSGNPFEAMRPREGAPMFRKSLSMNSYLTRDYVRL